MSEERPSSVKVWVEHMLGCRRCRSYNVKLGRYEAASRRELCTVGAVLLDAFLDEGVPAQLQRKADGPNTSHTEVPIRFGGR